MCNCPVRVGSVSDYLRAFHARRRLVFSIGGQFIYIAKRRDYVKCDRCEGFYWCPSAKKNKGKQMKEQKGGHSRKVDC